MRLEVMAVELRRQSMNNINDVGVENLRNAVVMRAVQDYKRALYVYNTTKKPDDKRSAKATIDECTLFFKENLSAYCDIDGDKIINKLQCDVDKRLKKIGIKMGV